MHMRCLSKARGGISRVGVECFVGGCFASEILGKSCKHFDRSIHLHPDLFVTLPQSFITQSGSHNIRLIEPYDSKCIA